MIKMITFLVQRRQELEKKEAEEAEREAEKDRIAQEKEECENSQVDVPMQPNEAEEMQEGSLLPSSKRLK